MAHWIRDLSTPHLVLLVLGILVLLAIAAAAITRALVRKGLRTPFVIRIVNQASDRVIDTIKRPITIAVLDEVADVIETGHYTQNISAALIENHDEIKKMVSDKVRADPASKVIGHLPLYDTIVNQVTETTMRVLVNMLGDPRMDELVSDLIRNNLGQIKQAVRDRQNEQRSA